MIDSHAHLSCESVREQLEAMIARAHQAGLSHIINICTDPQELAHALVLQKQYPWIKVAGATTPHDVETEGESAFAAFEKAALEGSLAAIGETGLDYFYEHSHRQLQQEFLRRYLRLAHQCNLPIVIHCREAFVDLFKILNEESWGRGILHCFTGTLEEAKEIVAHGWMISFSGIVTFKKSEPLRDIVKALPLDHLLVETDTPYLAPQSKRGQQNEPAFVFETARCMAELKGIDLTTFAEAMEKNLTSIFFK